MVTFETTCCTVYGMKDWTEKVKVERMKLLNAVEGQEYIVEQIETDDEEMDAFLFSLGTSCSTACTTPAP